MIDKLQIRNYAIIDELDISFTPGLNIITGETGAGKSILMGALNLVLGQRADTQVLFDTSRKCLVEAVFRVKKQDRINRFFSENDLDEEDEIRLRREISSNGKSRSFINDTPVNLSQLRSLSHMLVDLHQQFDTLELGSEDFQREALDAFCGNLTLASTMAGQYAIYQSARHTLDELRRKQHQANLELDYNRFLFDELDTLALKDNEAEELEAESRLLENADAVRAQLSGASHILKESEQPLVQQIKTIVNRLRPLQEFHPDLTAITDRLQSAQLELADIADELQRIDDHIESSPGRLAWVQDRLSSIYTLYRKHGVKTTAALLSIQETLQGKLDAVMNLSSGISEWEKKTSDAETACLETAAKLSKARHKEKDSLGDKVDQLLKQVGMPNARLKIDIEKSVLSFSGTDDIRFLFDANKTDRFESLQKVASGGELSRLMLSIKSLVAGKLQLPTLIFDEIDTGISGEAARQVGMIMKGMSGNHQIIAITHQPQIAARASSHFFVYKKEEGGRIKTSIRKLDVEERIMTIARMLSGEKPTPAAVENARELVEA